MTDDLVHDIEKDLQKEKWLALWQRYGLSASLGLVLILLASAALGYWMYQSRVSQDLASSKLLEALYFAELPSPKDNPQDNLQPLETFLKEPHTKWPLHALASTFSLARHYALNNKTDALLSLLLDTPPSHIPYYDDILTLWKGQAYVLNNQPKEAIALFQPLSQSSSSWRYLALEWLAEIALHTKDTQTAIIHLQTITDDIQAPQALRQRATRMLKVLS